MFRSCQQFVYFISIVKHRAMSSHIDRTKYISRGMTYSNAIVEQICDISPTVKQLTLHVDNDQLSFKPGQWVDFHIPNFSIVGGYSICSSPSLLSEQKKLILAVKYSDHPPAHWVHTKCKDGDSVGIQVGGNFFRLATLENILHENVLLIGGGVGINPLYSILKNISEKLTEVEEFRTDSINCDTGKVLLLYSASHLKELIFKREIDQICDSNGTLKQRYFVTKENIKHNIDGSVINHRITENSIKSAVADLSNNDKKLICYLCGPSVMMDYTKKILLEIGLKIENIYCESWW